MTRDDIISMAREAGAHEKHLVMYMDFDDLERFASLVASAERKACEKVCLDKAFEIRLYCNETHVIECASAIRARSTP